MPPVPKQILFQVLLSGIEICKDSDFVKMCSENVSTVYNEEELSKMLTKELAGTNGMYIPSNRKNNLGQIILRYSELTRCLNLMASSFNIDIDPIDLVADLIFEEIGHALSKSHNSDLTGIQSESLKIAPFHTHEEYFNWLKEILEENGKDPNSIQNTDIEIIIN